MRYRLSEKLEGKSWEEISRALVIEFSTSVIATGLVGWLMQNPCSQVFDLEDIVQSKGMEEEAVQEAIEELLEKELLIKCPEVPPIKRKYVHPRLASFHLIHKPLLVAFEGNYRLAVYLSELLDLEDRFTTENNSWFPTAPEQTQIRTLISTKDQFDLLNILIYKGVVQQTFRMRGEEPETKTYCRINHDKIFELINIGARDWKI